MSRFLRDWWRPLGVALMAAALLAAPAGSAAHPPAEGDLSTAAALRAPTAHHPSPFLAAIGISAELPAAEVGSGGPRPGSPPRATDWAGAGSGTSSTTASASRIRGQQLLHDDFAAENLAARAGLLSSRTTAPPPPLG